MSSAVATGLYLASLTSLAPAQFVKWNASTGLKGPGNEQALIVRQAEDGGYFALSSLQGGTLLTHYDSAGGFLWKRSFPDQYPNCYDIRATGDGVVVAGGNSLLVSTRKFSDGGTQVWWNVLPSRRIAPWGFGSCFLGVDGTGAVTVAVDSAETPQSTFDNGVVRTDVLLYHYAPNGSPSWNKTFGSTGSFETAESMAVDAVGDIWLAGEKEHGQGRDVFLTRYDSTGKQLWLDTYDALPSDPDNSFDQANAMVVNANYHCFLAIQPGTSSPENTVVREYGPWGGFWHETALPTHTYVDEMKMAPGDQVVGTGSNGSLQACFKISSARSLRWYKALAFSKGALSQYELERPTSMDVDGGGNTYLTYTTYSAPDPDAATARINDDGTVAWIERESGGAHQVDSGRSLLFDTSGKIVTMATINTGSTDYMDVRLTALGTSGVPLWHSQRELGPQGTAFRTAMVDGNWSGWFDQETPMYATVADGSSYLTHAGLTQTFQTSPANWTAYSDGYLTKVNGSGTVAWSKRFDFGPAYINSPMLDMPDGGVTVLLNVVSPSSSYKLQRYDPAGTILWTMQMQGRIFGATHDSSGNLYLSGVDSAGNSFLEKFSSSGALAWTKPYWVDQFAWDSTANALVALHAVPKVGGGGPIVLERIHGDGTMTWQTTIGYVGIPGAEGLYYTRLRIAGGRIYVTATDGLRTSSVQYYAQQLAFSDSTGALLWKTTFDTQQTAVTTFYRVTDCVIDSSGNQYLLASLRLPQDTLPSASKVYKISSAGQVLWNLGMPPGLQRLVLSGGNVFACGTIRQAATSDDLAVCKITPAGALAWPLFGQGVTNGIAFYDTGWHDQDDGWGFTATTDGGVYGFAELATSSGTRTASVVKFSDP